MISVFCKYKTQIWRCEIKLLCMALSPSRRAPCRAPYWPTVGQALSRETVIDQQLSTCTLMYFPISSIKQRFHFPPTGCENIISSRPPSIMEKLNDGKMTHIYLLTLVYSLRDMPELVLLFAVLFLKPGSPHRVTMCNIFRCSRSLWDYRVSDIHAPETGPSPTHLIHLLLRIQQVWEQKSWRTVEGVHILTRRGHYVRTTQPIII